MKLYRFSPIKNQKQLIEAIKYVAVQTTKLSKKTIGKELSINSLTIFSHYTKEYEQLTKFLFKMGRHYKENNGPYVLLYQPIKFRDNKITHLRIRKPDPYRMQVGCNDFEIDNYKAFKKSNLKNSNKNLRIIKRPEYEMIEFFNPDFDVLAYVVSNKEF